MIQCSAIPLQTRAKLINMREAKSTDNPDTHFMDPEEGIPSVLSTVMFVLEIPYQRQYRQPTDNKS